MNYQGYEIKQDLTIWKDGKQFFQAIPCHSVRDAELLIDSYLMANEMFMRFPSLSKYDIKQLLS